MSPCWVTFEGVEGVGKTYLSQRLAERIGPDCVLLSELTDRTDGDLSGQVIAALSSEGDAFLRTGHPLTETFALLALKAREYERLQSAACLVRLVVEDRGVDSVALYQAAILGAQRPAEHMNAVAQRIYAAAALWRPAPNMTVLLLDDFEACARRFAHRLGRRLRDDERALMRSADRLYAMQAAAEPQRFVLIDRREYSTTQTLDLLHRMCLERMAVEEE